MTLAKILSVLKNVVQEPRCQVLENSYAHDISAVRISQYTNHFNGDISTDKTGFQNPF